MVGADVSQTETRGHPIQGDAEITIAHFENPQATIAFTRIFDLDSQTRRDDMTLDWRPGLRRWFRKRSRRRLDRGSFLRPET